MPKILFVKTFFNKSQIDVLSAHNNHRIRKCNELASQTIFDRYSLQIHFFEMNHEVMYREEWKK